MDRKIMHPTEDERDGIEDHWYRRAKKLFRDVLRNPTRLRMAGAERKVYNKHDELVPTYNTAKKDDNTEE